MTRIKLLAIGAITATMILGSTIVLATGPLDQSAGDVAIESTGASVIELANPGPAPKRGGGGSGRALRR
jgi:hypothetical protein